MNNERMSRVDTAWLRMDSPTNLMMIVGVWVLQPGLRRADLAARLEERLLKYPRFTQRAVEDATGASWVTDAKFDLARHLVCEQLPGAGGQAALQDRLAQLCMEPLDKQHPLWQFHLVENYQGGSALMVRIHHCIADGIALISVMNTLVDGGSAPPVRPKKEPRAPGLEGAPDLLADVLFKPMAGIAVRALGLAGNSASKSMELMLDPNASADAARVLYQVMGDVAALALMPDDSPTSLKGLPGLQKRVAWCAPLPLADVKAVSKALRCSINDVLLSCVAGAIGQYLVANGEAVTDKEIRAMVPVNLRPLSQAHKLGNQFGLAPLVLPVGIANPVQRVFEVRTRMAGLKDSVQPLLAYGMLAVAGLLVKPAQDALLQLYTNKTTAVMTNVPGPKDKLKICGSTIDESLFWVPQSGSVGLGVSILSYGGGVQFGVVSDAILCPDPQLIIDRFGAEFDKLLLTTLMLPWGE